MSGVLKTGFDVIDEHACYLCSFYTEVTFMFTE